MNMRFAMFALILALRGVLAPADDDYCPIAIGQETVMTFSLEPRNGKVIHDVYHALVEGKVEKEGKTYYRVRSWLEVNRLKQDPIKFKRKDPRGVYSLPDKSVKASEDTELVLPLKIGATWTQTVFGKSFETTIIGRETVTAGETTYTDCYHLLTRSKNGNFKEDQWVAPNIGIVKDQSILDSGTTMTYTIKEFKPGE